MRSWTTRLCCCAVAGVLVTAGLAACGSSSTNSGDTPSASSPGAATTQASSSNTPISILWIGDTTGPSKEYGSVELAGLKGAAAYYNSQGGVDGHRITVQAMSDNSDPSVAVSDLLKGVQSKPTMVWAGTNENDISALIPALARQDVLSESHNDGALQCATDATKTCPNEWTFGEPTADLPVETVANWMKSRHYSKVGILAEDDTNSTTETPYAQKWLKAAGIESEVVEFPPTATDITAELSELKGEGAQAVFFEGIGAASGYVLTDRAKLGWNAPVLEDLDGSSLDLTTLAPAADVKNTYETIFRVMSPADKSPGIQNLIKYSKPYGDVTSVPLDVAVCGWDAVVDLADAVKVSGGNLAVKSLDAAMLKLSPTDPERLYSQKLGYTNNDHEDTLGAPSDFEVVPAGPVVGGQVAAQ
jgi:ABC-type branched-subunit amino acid transport system substrate-binding protein